MKNSHVCILFAFLLAFVSLGHFLLCCFRQKIRSLKIKAGGMRISKKQEIGILEKHSKTSAIANVAKIQAMDALSDTLEKLSHKFPAIVHMAHQKPRPTLEKVTPLKRIYIIQQPRKC